MARWNKQQREAARARVLEAAREAFEADGFEGASMRQIAQSAGLAVGTLFNYFPDKRALLHAALHDDLEAVLEACIQTMPGAEEGLEALLVHTAGCFFDHYAKRPALSQALLGQSLWAEGEAGAAFQSQVQRLGVVLVGRIQALQEGGGLSVQASAQHIALAFFSHYYFVLLTGLRDAPDPARMRDTIGALARQLEAGVGAD